MTQTTKRLRCATVAALLALAGAAGAAGAAPAADPAARAIELFINAETAGLPGRVEIRIGAPDGRQTAAPCAAVEPFLPAGSRLWGRSTLGLRCRDTTPGAVGWSAMIPVEIRVYGQALVAARPIAAGEVLGADAYTLREIELTREPRGVLTDAAQIGGQVAARALAAGQVLRSDLLRQRQVINAGEQVKVVASGRGFQISTQGRALNPAAAGQTVRVQSESGRMLSGTARADGSVELRL